MVFVMREQVREDSVRSLVKLVRTADRPSDRKTDAVDMMLRGQTLPTGAVVVRANWADNPRFPAVLEHERQDCLRDTPEQYNHIWEGGYATVLEGRRLHDLGGAVRREGDPRLELLRGRRPAAGGAPGVDAVAGL